eukprot:1357545-Lingulodinium_polyedra.AAC.1
MNFTIRHCMSDIRARCMVCSAAFLLKKPTPVWSPVNEHGLMACDTVVDFLKIAVKPSTSLAWGDAHKLGALLESAKAAERQAAINLITEAEGMPVLSSYSNDGTPVKYVQAVYHTDRTNAKRVKKGKQGREVLVQNQFFRWYDGAGGCRTVLVSRDPVPLTEDKSGDSIFACLKEQYLMARDHGHLGIAISHVVFDGAQHSFLSRRVQQYHLERAIARAPMQREQGHDPK